MEFTSADIIKLQCALVAFLVVVPFLVAFARHDQWRRRALMVGFIFLPTLGTAPFLGIIKSNFTLMSVEHYRGHTTGFTIGLQDIIGVALLIALYLSRHRHHFRLIPPGMIYFLLFYLAISLSIFQAPVTEYSLMAMWNFGRMFLYYTVIYNFIRGSGDLRTVLWSIALCLFFQCLISLKMRYLNGVHQVPGTFDHQNSMASWAYFCGLPMLALGLSQQARRLDTAVYLAAYACAGMLAVLSISRGALLVFACGSLLIVIHAILQKPTLKRVLLIGAGFACGSFVLLVSLDSILGRFVGSNDYDKKHNLRIVLEEISHEMLADNPHGVGLNNYNVVNSRPYTEYSAMLERWNERRGYWFPDEYYERNPNTENLYWMFLAETGYVGFAGLGIFLAYSLFVSIRCYLPYRRTLQGSFMLGLIVTLGLFYLHSQLERVFTQPINMMMFVMCIALVARYDREHRREMVPTLFRLWKLNQAYWDTAGRRAAPPRQTGIGSPEPSPAGSPTPTAA